MRHTTKKILALLLAAVTLLACTGCGRNNSNADDGIPESTGGKDVERAAAADDVFSLYCNPRYSFNPFIATNRANQLICDLVYENIVEIDNNFEVIEGSGIITAWEHSDDGRLWTFTMDMNHTFHDGSPVTPSDVSYSLGMCINSDRFTGRFASYQGASPTEDGFQVTLGIGDADFIKLLNVPIIKRGTYDKGDGSRPVGSGPYMYNEDYTELIAFEDYAHAEGKLPVDTIYIKEITTADGTISAFEDGIIDVVVNDPSSYTNLGYASTNEIHTFATTNMHYVAFNEESTYARYSYFRVAMQYAFDREYLVELLHGNAVASPIPMYPTCSLYPTNLANSLTYNLETCRKILAVAGVQDYDEDGQMDFMSAGQKIDLNFAVCSDSAAKAGIVRRFQEDMASIGLKVTVHELTWDDYMTALQEGVIQVGNQQVPLDMYYGEVRLRNNFDLTELLQPRTEKNERTNLNFTNSTDATVVDRVNAYLAAAGPSRASAYYQLCEFVTSSSGSLITIGFEKQQIITHRGVCKGIDANMGNPLYNFANWTIELSDQPILETEEEAD